MDIEKKIMLVDKDHAFIKKIARFLDDGYTCDHAANATAALELAGRNHPRIIFFDVGLPGVTPRDFFIKLKRVYDRLPIQVVLMSSTAEARSLGEILDGGADDFIRKPFEALEFQLRVKAARIRLLAQQALFDEREFYRHAVRQEEDLTVKLLDKQIGLRETLADLEGLKNGLELENTKLEAIARFDVLTGLLNRHSLDARLALEMRRAREDDQALAGMMLDIDHFKAINDTFGHLTGDEMLRVLGDAIRKCLRREDYAGRYGGDEFFIILPGSQLDTALAVAERIKSAVMFSSIDAAGIQVTATVSIGVAMCRKDDSVADWISRTDTAMYKAKQHGRNQIQG
jgi:two-component system, cell cycle response regulator